VMTDVNRLMAREHGGYQPVHDLVPHGHPPRQPNPEMGPGWP
jgi:hypothetical protein